MLGKLLKFLVIVGVAGLAVFYIVTQPVLIPDSEIPDAPGDVAKGEYMFYASGCASCHAAPKAEGKDKLKLAGGKSFKTPFGTFYAPNISPDPEHGIGG